MQDICLSYITKLFTSDNRSAINQKSKVQFKLTDLKIHFVIYYFPLTYMQYIQLHPSQLRLLNIICKLFRTIRFGNYIIPLKSYLLFAAKCNFEAIGPTGFLSVHTSSLLISIRIQTDTYPWDKLA